MMPRLCLALLLLGLGAEADPREHKSLRLSTANTTSHQAEVVGKQASMDADLDALDAATSNVAKRFPGKPAPAKPAQKAREARWGPRHHKAVTHAKPDPSNLSVLNKDTSLFSNAADAADRVLSEADAHAKASEQARRLQELEREAPAKVQRVAPPASVKPDELKGPLRIEEDAKNLKMVQQQVTEKKHNEQADELSAAEERRLLEKKKPAPQVDLGKVAQLANEADSDAKSEA